MSFRNLLPIGRAFDASADRTGRYQLSEKGVPDFAVPGVPPGPGVVESEPRVVGSPARDGGGKRRGRRLPGWVESLILMLLRPGRNRRRGTRVVQGELAFQRVRVVRNDLATSDVEVVAVPPSVGRESLSAACRSRVLKLWWDQGAERLKRLGSALR